MAFMIVIGIAVMWVILTALIYGGFYLLRYFTIIPADRVLTFNDVLEYSEFIIIALIVAAVVGVILHEAGIIDLTTLLPDKKKK